MVVGDMKILPATANIYLVLGRWQTQISSLADVFQGIVCYNTPSVCQSCFKNTGGS